MTVTSITALLVRRGCERELLSAWGQLQLSLQGHPGFRSGALLRATEFGAAVLRTAFSHVGLLNFKDERSFARAIATPPVETAWRALDQACIMTPGLFEPIAGVLGAGRRRGLAPDLRAQA